MSVKEYAIESSEQYYNYLELNNGSLIRYGIESIISEDGYYFFKTKNQLNFTDNLKILVNRTIFTEEEIKIISYDKSKRVLKTSTSEEIGEYLLKTKVEYISLISDLKFLVKNVKLFFQKHGDNLALPINVKNVPYIENPLLTDKPSDEQLNAIKCILNNPLAYIWGAPGTGKTRFVLARCILAYIKADPNAKILITAPTNNAVEQILYGVLPVLSSCEINLNKVFRMGIPTNKFSDMYPECCEYSSIDTKIKNADNKLEKTEKEITLVKEKITLFKSREKCIEFEKSFIECKNNATALIDDIISLTSDIKNAESDIKIYSGKLAFEQDQLNFTLKQKEDYSCNLKNKTDLKDKYSKGIRKIFYKSKVKALNSNIDDLYSLISECDTNIYDFNHNISDYKNKISNCKKTVIENKEQCFIKKETISNYTMFWNRLSEITAMLNLNSSHNCTIKSMYNRELSACKNKLIEKHKRYIKIADCSEDDLYKSLANLSEAKLELTEKINKLKEYSSSDRIKSCNVIATTVDTCISRIPPDTDFRPTHIFLDEAGYCPLIKSAALLVYHCPIAMLGDHKQLPPICEMSDNYIMQLNSSIYLYAQSALYLDDFMVSPKMGLHNYINHEPPLFENTAYTELNYSFRFGEELAEILAGYVYSENFHGTTMHSTNIYFINAEYSECKERNTSKKECDAIEQYLAQHNEESVGIITPYVNQKKLLKNKLKSYEVLTVHGSQGREWDTVIFSVVDSKSMWFTNSMLLKSNGLAVVNTAVSRAKKKLIIVCDTKYWKKRNKQLIGKLINIAEEIIL